MSLGKYYDQAMAGNVFIGSTVSTGTAFPVSAGTAGTFGLWNTAPKKAAVLLRFNAGVTSGTIGIGQFGLDVARVGWEVGTTHPLTAFTDGVPPKNALTIGGKVTAMRFSTTAVTLTAGYSLAYLWLGAAQESTTLTSGLTVMSYDFDGTVIVMPGSLVHVVGSAAQAGVFSMSLIWAEIDI